MSNKMKFLDALIYYKDETDPKINSFDRFFAWYESQLEKAKFKSFQKGMEAQKIISEGIYNDKIKEIIDEAFDKGVYAKSFQGLTLNNLSADIAEKQKLYKKFILS